MRLKNFTMFPPPEFLDKIEDCLQNWPKLQVLHCSRKIADFINFKNFEIKDLITDCDYDLTDAEDCNFFAKRERIDPLTLEGGHVGDYFNATTLVWYHPFDENEKFDEKIVKAFKYSMKRVDSLEIDCEYLSHCPEFKECYDKGFESFKSMQIKNLKLDRLCFNAETEYTQDLLEKTFLSIEKLTMSYLHYICDGCKPMHLISWISSFKNLRRIELIRLHESISLSPPENMMYFVKEVYIGDQDLQPFTSEFLNGCVEKMPNLEFWTFGNIWWAGKSFEEIKAFLDACKHLKPFLCTKNVEIRGLAKFGNRIKDLLVECCEIINRNFRIDTTEIKIFFFDFDFDECCRKEMGQAAAIVKFSLN